MLADLLGSVNRIKINRNDGVFTIFEAVVNSIQSDSKNILVELKTEKDKQSSFEITDKKEKDVLAEVIITDDGYGFNDENFESFKKINSTHKLKLGGKGVGRLTWLKVFENIEIESTYKQDKKYFFRKIFFNLYDEVKEVESKELPFGDQKQIKTTIKFKKPKGDFLEKFPITAEDLGEKILYHCLSYLIEGVFEITIKDNKNEYRCKDEYRSRLENDIKKDTIKINKEEFDIIYIPIDKKKLSKHEISFTANKREVYRRGMSGELLKSSFEIDKKEKYILAFIRGNYLDNSVSEDRTRFFFPDEDGGLFLSEKEIINSVSNKIITIFDKSIEIIREKNKNKINIFLNENPYYRAVYKYNETIVDEINSRTTNDEIEEKFEKTVRQKLKEIKTNIKTLELNGNYQEKFEETIEKIDVLKQLDLAKYIVHRKIIIELFDKILEKKENDKNYYYEKDLHNLIFPMKKYGEEVDYNNHNLWLIDDRLSYHTFLSSDKPFNEFNENSTNKERADLVILNNLISFSDKEVEELHSNVIIVEFKRPGRDSLIEYDLNTQIYKYIEELLDSKIKTKNGKRIEIDKNAIFNVYIICELSSELVKTLRRANYKELLEGQGYYFYNDSYNTLIQVFSLNKVLRDVKLRNKIFFKQLGVL
ncbi:ATP-binding protein [Fusobacterium canifelinum]|uniref:ATP-binding protein n=1 Tax=Fusobacterium canifelinum TaxID=285729 RepID=A0ABX7CDQ6_9FUSO|nr:ATP-binding protein [Fusobacterium canifelinum]QQS87648.1 ATP-binding protein [Fusobacterium canifelinum]